FYWWSARRLVIIRTDAPSEIREATLDEDILYVFAHAGDWVLVCETSLRLHRGATEVARVEFPEVITFARLEGSQLVVEDAGGVTRGIAISTAGLESIDKAG